MITMYDENNERINTKKLGLMKLKILLMEKENLKTHEKTNEQMVEQIRKIIQEEAKKNY